MTTKKFDVSKKMPGPNQTVYSLCTLLNVREDDDNLGSRVKVIRHGDPRDPRSIAVLKFIKGTQNQTRNVFDLVYLDKEGKAVFNPWRQPGTTVSAICEVLKLDRYVKYSDEFLDALFELGFNRGKPEIQNKYEKNFHNQGNRDTKSYDNTDVCDKKCVSGRGDRKMATVNVVQIKRADALAILLWVGFNSAEKWKDERVAQKLKIVPEVKKDEDPEDESVAITLGLVLAAIEAGDDIEVIAGDISQKEETKSSKTEEPKKAEKAAFAEKVGPKAPKAPKEKTHPRPLKNRVYCAAIVIKEAGLDSALTDEMAEKVDELVGKPNPKESKAWLSVVWHALNGFTGEFPVEE